MQVKVPVLVSVHPRWQWSKWLLTKQLIRYLQCFPFSHHDVLRDIQYLSLWVPECLLCPWVLKVLPAAEVEMKRHPRGTNETRQAVVGSYHHAWVCRWTGCWDPTWGLEGSRAICRWRWVEGHKLESRLTDVLLSWGQLEPQQPKGRITAPSWKTNKQQGKGHQRRGDRKWRWIPQDNLIKIKRVWSWSGRRGIKIGTFLLHFSLVAVQLWKPPELTHWVSKMEFYPYCLDVEVWGSGIWSLLFSALIIENFLQKQAVRRPSVFSCSF